MFEHDVPAFLDELALLVAELALHGHLLFLVLDQLDLVAVELLLAVEGDFEVAFRARDRADLTLALGNHRADHFLGTQHISGKTF